MNDFGFDFGGDDFNGGFGGFSTDPTNFGPTQGGNFSGFGGDVNSNGGFFDGEAANSNGGNFDFGNGAVGGFDGGSASADGFAFNGGNFGDFGIDAFGFGAGDFGGFGGFGSIFGDLLNSLLGVLGGL